VPLVVHSMAYSDSLEGHAHLSEVERERQALVSLIDFKQHIVIPVDLEPGQQVLWGMGRASIHTPLTRC
jgi:hypothetical protein